MEEIKKREAAIKKKEELKVREAGARATSPHAWLTTNFV
jgi:hypothetical protein